MFKSLNHFEIDEIDVLVDITKIIFDITMLTFNFATVSCGLSVVHATNPIDGSSPQSSYRQKEEKGKTVDDKKGFSSLGH